MISKSSLIGFVISPLATSLVMSIAAVALLIVGADASVRDAFEGSHRLIVFNTILSYIFAFVLGLPFIFMLSFHKRHKFWQHSVAGLLGGFVLGVIIVLIVSLLPSFKWVDSYSPFVTIIYSGLAGTVTMCALWPFGENSKWIQPKR
jgi:hypothetical protein